MTEPMPSEKGRAARIALAVLIGALGTTLFAAGLWLAFRPDPTPPPQTEIEPAEETEAPTTTPPPSAEQSPSTGTTDGATSSPDGDDDGSEQPLDGFFRAERIAFRVGVTIYAADEDGSNAKSVIRSTTGPYSLSPDGRTVAVVEAGRLRLGDVATGRERNVGPAEESAGIAWYPDSKRLLFGRSETEEATRIWRVNSDGTGARALTDGEQAGISPDGRVVVVRQMEDAARSGDSFVTVSVNGSSFRRVAIPDGTVTAVATNGDRVFAGLSSGDRMSGILSVNLQGGDRRQLAGPIAGDVPAIWSMLVPSPDGAVLAAAVQGDDGFARTYIVPARGGQPLDLTLRRDTLPHEWSASGREIFLLEGNPVQGESYSLLRVERDGSPRVTIVTGAE